MAWLLQHSPVMVPIPGTSSIEHLEENVAAARCGCPKTSSPRWRRRPAGTDSGRLQARSADDDRPRPPEGVRPRAAERFYVDLLGFHVTARYGSDAVFLSAGDNHHDLGLNTWESKGGAPPPAGTTGLFHFAIRVPTRRRLAEMLVRLRDAGVRFSGASDHLVSEALYLTTPTATGSRSTATATRPMAASNGEIKMATLPLDLESLLAELEN